MKISLCTTNDDDSHTHTAQQAQFSVLMAYVVLSRIRTYLGTQVLTVVQLLLSVIRQPLSWPPLLERDHR